ncbi:disease resistance protein At4g27190-like [Pistacia vera]|uniref:disease resistance protein At4g27190-like n=1 Tax=Pistacia vera TaxID=55513 RepID=UPI00126329B1|nr:disease resistance protein At4g27190-like [Pistacia vera]
MEVVVAIASKVGEYLVKPTVNQVRYLFCFNTIVEELKEQEINLKLARQNVNKDVEIAKNNTDEIKGDVEKWLTDANKILADVEGLKEETGAKKTCLNGWCPNWGWRYWLGRKAAKKTTIMLKLKDNCQFNGVGYPTTLPGIEFLKPSEFQTFGSSKSAIDDIIGALKNDEIDMVGLYGMGGAGKTTLAKEVGNRVKEIFNEVVMVTISQTPNFKNIQGQLASSLGLRFTETDEKQGVEGRARRLCLRFTETEKKILVILDDVWGKFELKSILGIPFGDDNKNCKTLLTTRRQQVCIDMECQARILLNVLNDDEAVASLKRHAGIGDASNLNPLAIKIAKECDGLPLALVAIGSALREKDSDEWKVLHDKLRHSKLEDMISVTGEDNIVAGERGIYATLKLSYDYLKGEQIQFCFLLCSLFPEDYKICLDELVRIGIGLDLYQDVNSIKVLRKQFQVMVNNLKASGLLIDAGEEVVKMHDMVRDVAIWISSKGKHVFMNKASLGLTERPKKKMLEQCTAISLMDHGSDINLLPQGLVCPRLEILLLNFGINPGEFFKDMKALQVVTIMNVDPVSFKSLELLTNLQSLKLKHCRLQDISFLGKLTTLKVLDLEGSYLAEEWPKELGDQLSELRVLDVRLSDELRIPRDGLRRFSQLEELYTDEVFLWDSDEITSVEESYATLCELNSLSCLVSLSLRIHHSFVSNGFAFPKLQRFMIEVSEGYYAVDSAGYKGSLNIGGIEAASLIAFEELFQNLQSLSLFEIKGLQNCFPSVDQTCFSELICLESGFCEELKCIIDTSQRQAPAAAFSNLKTLILSNMSHIEEIYKGAEPPSTFLEKLETVKISGCHSMCNVYPPMLLQRLRQLKTAEIFFCNKLSEVFKLEGLCQTEGENSAVLSSLESLQLRGLPELRFIWKGPIRLVSFKNLAHVKVDGCSYLKNLFALSIVRRLVQLEELIISDCDRLEHVVSDYNQGDEIAEIENGKNIVLPKLIKLRLQNLPKLISFCSENYYPTCPMLQLLEVDFCPSWTTPIIVEANMQNPPEFRHLQDCNDDVIPGTLFHFSQNLEDLKLIGCAVQVVFQLEGVVAEGRQHKLSFPSLKNLQLKFLEKLEGLCMGLSLTSLRNLTNLEVDSCSRLRYIFSATLARNMMQLKYLHVSECAELEQIIAVEEEEDQAFLNNNLQSETFQNLLKVRIKSCSKLKCLFPTTIARGLQQLEELYVEDSVQLEEVFGHKDVAAIMEDEEIVLPQLNYLTLKALPSLTNFFCHFIFPSLRKLEVEDCGATVSIFSLTRGERVHADKKKLRVLRIDDCNNLCGGISLFSCGFNNLEYLSIWNCGVKVVFQLGDLAVDGQSHQLSFPSLKNLELRGLKELEGLCNGSKHVLSLQNLTTLNISYCPRLTHIFSITFARNMMQLETLSVEGCMELQQIVVEDDDGDHLQSLFPNLSKIDVKWCDKLKCVLPITMARGLQQLKVVTVVSANQLEEVFGHTDRVDVMTDQEIQLPQLDELLFLALPNLANFCPVGYHFIFPSLNTLVVKRCPKMNTTFSFNKRNNFVRTEAKVLC